jgi:NAD(P)-dependent dehydrogenase (short-subunit alcohol dehydrogenase family)
MTAMTAPVLDQLQVLVTGVEAGIARDVARLVASEGATVLAADADADKLARLERDLALYRITVETAVVELGSESQVRLWEMSLSARGRLPHLMVCCCGSRASPPRQGRTARHAADVALGAHPGCDCLAQIAQRALQPTLFLHAAPLRRSAFDRALSVLRHPTLQGVLERAPGHGIFSPAAAVPYVRLALHVYSLSRELDTAPTAPGPRLRLVPPIDPPIDDAAPQTADAA